MVCLNYDDAAEAEFVREFMAWMTSAQGQDLAESVAGSSPISDTLRGRITSSLAAITSI